MVKVMPLKDKIAGSRLLCTQSSVPLPWVLTSPLPAACHLSLPLPVTCHGCVLDTEKQVYFTPIRKTHAPTGAPGHLRVTTRPGPAGWARMRKSPAGHSCRLNPASPISAAVCPSPRAQAPTLPEP